MVALLRCSRFTPADFSQMIFLDLRRLQDINAIATGGKTKQFVVTRRGHAMNGRNDMKSRHFDTVGEARRYWCEHAMKLEDQGMQRMDLHISGFHEED